MNKIIESIDSFINYLKFEKMFSPHTILAYTKDLEAFNLFLDDMELNYIEEITGDIIRKYLFHLRTSNYEYSSIERKLSTLKSLFSFLIKTQSIENNPVKNIPFPKKKKNLPVFLTQDEVLDLLGKEIIDETPLSIRDSAIIELLYGSGIRLSELHRIDIESIDIDNKQIRVVGKGNKPRIVPINDICIKKILLYMNVIRNKINLKDDKALFVSKNGRRLCQRHLAKIVKKFSQLVLGRSDISPHSLRHSYATHLLENGADIKLISRLLGHSSINTTQKYTHINLKKVRDTYLNSHPHSNPINKENNDDRF